MPRQITVTLTFDREHLESIARSYAMLRQEPSLPISTKALRAALHQTPSGEECWGVGQIVRHGVGSEWELIEHIGGRHDDWRARCVKAAYRGGESLDVERTFHREYMDRSFTVVAQAPTPPAPDCAQHSGEEGEREASDRATEAAIRAAWNVALDDHTKTDERSSKEGEDG